MARNQKKGWLFESGQSGRLVQFTTDEACQLRRYFDDHAEDFIFTAKDRLSSRLYFVTDGKYVKIGRTRLLVTERIRRLQCGNPLPIRRLAEYQDVSYVIRNLEGILHHWLSEYHVSGEWYDILWMFDHPDEKEYPPILLAYGFTRANVEEIIRIRKERKGDVTVGL